MVTDSYYPRISFVLIAFNQRDFIEHAVACAFAQDYPNLQIVLSDDNSEDGTYDRMVTMAANYRGPHSIVLNRSAGGRGVLAHFSDALRFVDGILMVGAAGDDMSAPNRVSKLVNAWRNTKAVGIYSAWNRVDVAGNFLAREGIENQRDRDMASYFPDRNVTIAFGCTAAYETAFLQSICAPTHRIWCEDYFWSAVAMMTGGEILYLDEALVSYRQNPSALRNFSSGKSNHFAYELREAQFFAGLADLLEAFIEVVDRGSLEARTRIDRHAIVGDIAWYRYRADWFGCNLSDRIKHTAGLRSLQRLRWAVPRLLGLKAFLAVKRLARSRE